VKSHASQSARSVRHPPPGSTQYNEAMTPPDIVLDRWLKAQARERPRACRSYVGKLDLDKVEPSSFGSFLQFVQGALNLALQSENANASGGAVHPPFHFDYVEVNDGTRNAHAFQHGGFSFIAITFPLVELLWDLSQRLSRSPLVLRLLGIDRDAVRLDALQALFFQFQLSFLVSHEYTHHVHRNCGSPAGGAWDEFSQGGARGGLDDQAQELDADGYALYLTLANYVRGTARQNTLAQVGKEGLTDIEGDEFLLTGFFVALTALFCSLWPEDVAPASICQAAHPPAPVRIDYAIRIATMWCNQNASVPELWFGAERFRAIYLSATDAIEGGARPQWDAQIAFLKSDEGKKYDRQLSERFEAARRQGRPLSRSTTAG
jgi:hypothetical protein